MAAALASCSMRQRIPAQLRRFYNMLLLAHQNLPLKMRNARLVTDDYFIQARPQDQNKITPQVKWVFKEPCSEVKVTDMKSYYSVAERVRMFHVDGHLSEHNVEPPFRIADSNHTKHYELFCSRRKLSQQNIDLQPDEEEEQHFKMYNK